MTNEILQTEVIGIDELAKLNDEELDRVAGGYMEETARDSRFLNSLGRFTNRYGTFRILFEDHDAEIIHGWKMVGVDVEIHGSKIFEAGDWNVYRINGKIVEESDAREYAMKVTGHYMEREEWDW